MVDDNDLDDFEDDNDEQDEAALVRRLRGVIKEQKKRERTLVEQAEVNSAASKKLAFIEAKLPDEPQMKFFLDHYDGEYSAEAIRQAAADNGFIVLDQQTQDEVGAVQQMMNASNGSTATAAPGSDAALMDRINQVTPGPNASKQIRDIMASAGRYESDE